MHIIMGREAAEALKENYTVLFIFNVIEKKTLYFIEWLSEKYSNYCLELL